MAKTKKILISIAIIFALTLPILSQIYVFMPSKATGNTPLSIVKSKVEERESSLTNAHSELVYETLNLKRNQPVTLNSAGITWTKAPGNWWDTDWEYRINVTITEPGISNRTDWPVDVYIHFTPPAFKYSIRVIKLDGDQYTETPYQPWNITYHNSTHIDSATITFLVDLLQGESVQYQIYWSTSYKDLPTYTKRITVDEVTVSNGIMYIVSSKNAGWSVKLPPDKGGKVMNITLPSGDEVGHTWTQFGITRNGSLSYEGYWGDADTNNIMYTDRYILEQNDPLTSAFMGVVFVTYVVEGVPLYYKVQGVNLAKVDYYFRFYDFGFKVEEKLYEWNSAASSYFNANYFLGGWVFDQDDGPVDSTFDYVYTPSGLVNMSKAIYPEKYGSVTDTWSIYKVYDTATNLPIIQVFRVYLTAGTHSETIWTTGNDYYTNSWSSDDPYGRVMDPNGNWLELTDTGSSDYLVDNNYAIWHDGGGAGSGVDFSFNAPVDGYYYIVVGVLDDDNGDGDMSFRVELDGNDIGYGTLYTGFITNENDLTYLIPRSAISIMDFYPDSDLVGVGHKMSISWSTSDYDLDLILFKNDGSVAGYSISTGTTNEEVVFTPDSQVHYTALVIRYNGTGSTSFSLTTEALVGAEHEDFYGNNTAWDHIAFFHSSAGRGIGIIKKDLAYTGLTISDVRMQFYNEGNDSDIDYIFWALNVSIENPALSSQLNYTYYVVPWTPSGSTPTDRVNGFLNIYNWINNPVSASKNSIERFKIILFIRVLDNDDYAIKNAKVELINTSDSSVVYTEYTNSSGFAEIDAIRYEYLIKVTVSSGGRSYINDTLTIDYSTYDYVIHMDSRAIVMKNLIRFRLKAYTNTTEPQIIQDGRVIITNSSDATTKSEAYTNLTGWIDIYLKIGSWNISFNATKTSPTERWDNITIYSDSSLSTVVAGPDVNVTITITSGVIYYLKDLDITTAPTVTKLSLFQSLTFYEVYWTDTIHIYVNFTDNSGNGIDGTVYWYVINSSGGAEISGTANKLSTGSFNFTVDTSSLKGGKSYTILVNATPVDQVNYLKPTPLIIGLTVKNRITSLDVTLDPGTIIYWNETLKITAYFSDSLLHIGIPGADLEAIIYAETTIVIPLVDQGNGYYINTTREALEQLKAGSYLMVVRASKANYELKEKSITLVIKNRPTSLSYDEYIEIPWTSSYAIWVQYRDEIYQKPISNANVTYKLVEATSNVLIYSGEMTYLNGYWTVTLSLTSVSEGSYLIQIYAGKQNYENKTGTITFILRLHETIAQPDTTKLKIYYDQNITLTLTYYDSDRAEYIGGATATCTITSTEEGGPTLNVPQLRDYGNGTYKLDTRASELGRIGTYIITIEINKTHYRDQIVYVSLQIDPIPTSTSASKTTEEIEWGLSTNIVVMFNDSRTGAGLSADIANFSIINATHKLNYSLSVIDTGIYSLSIDTMTMHLAPGTYTIYVYLEKNHYENQTIVITLTVMNVRTITFVQPANLTLYWGDFGESVIYWNRTRDGSYILADATSLNITDLVTSEQISAGVTMSFVDGVYIVYVDASKLIEGHTYAVEVLFEKTYYESAGATIYVRVLAIPTSVVATPVVANITWGDDFNFSVSVINLLNGSGVDVNIQMTVLVGGSPTNVGDAITIISLGNGQYAILVKSGLLVSNQYYVIKLALMKPHYDLPAIELTAGIQPVAVDVSVKTSSTVLKNPATGAATSTIEVTLRESATGAPIRGAKVYVIVRLGGEVVFNITAQETDPGVYVATIDWSGVEPGDYSVSVQVKSITRHGYSASANIAASVSPASTGVRVDYLGGSTVVAGRRYPNLIIYPIIIAVFLVAGFIGYKYYSWFSLPIEVREVIQLIKKIQKDIYEYPAPSREDVFREIINNQLGLE